MNGRKAFLLIGSPKGKSSVSHSIGGYFLRRLEAGGMMTEMVTVGAALQSTESLHRMHKSLDEADLVVVSFPLYVDQLPAPLVQVLELIAERRKGGPGVSPVAGPTVQKIMAIVQCGFPENSHNRPAVEIMRLFARESGFQWAGALTMGMGGAVGRKPLDKAAGMVRNVVKALDVAAASLARGEDVPGEAEALMAKPLMPRWFYVFMANLGWRKHLRKHGMKDKAYARPHARP